MVGLLVVLLLAALVALAEALFLLGFSLGVTRFSEKLTELRTATARAEEHLHDLTAEALAAIVNSARRDQG